MPQLIIEGGPTLDVAAGTKLTLAIEDAESLAAPRAGF